MSLNLFALLNSLTLMKYRCEIPTRETAGPSNMICGFKTRFGSKLTNNLRRRRIGFRHFLPESGEGNSPNNLACFAEALAEAGKSCPKK